jgi:hypothetical protein
MERFDQLFFVSLRKVSAVIARERAITGKNGVDEQNSSFSPYR